jgi:hypothetical protein
MFIFSFQRRSKNYPEEPDKSAAFVQTSRRFLQKVLNQGKNEKKIQKLKIKLNNGKKQ